MIWFQSFLFMWISCWTVNYWFQSLWFEWCFECYLSWLSEICWYFFIWVCRGFQKINLHSHSSNLSYFPFIQSRKIFKKLSRDWESVKSQPSHSFCNTLSVNRLTSHTRNIVIFHHASPRPPIVRKVVFWLASFCWSCTDWWMVYLNLVFQRLSGSRCYNSQERVVMKAILTPGQHYFFLLLLWSLQVPFTRILQ